jgi:hypothetical protein
VRLHVLPPTSRANHHEISIGCTRCVWLPLCGGNYSETFDCMAFCCCNFGNCTLACPNSRKFAEVFRDSAGFDPYRHWDIEQDRQAFLPSYIPCLHHGSSRTGALDVSAVAIPTFELYSRRKGQFRYRSAGDLRRKFRLPSSCRIIGRTVGKDPKLETFWRYRHTRGYIEHLAKLGLTHIIAPNFSMAAETVRTDHIANRKRSLICAEELSRVGISVIPYLAAVTDFDWEFWYWFLSEHQHISLVAKEFQTGPGNADQGRWHANRLVELEQKVGRGLHVIGIAAQQQIDALRSLHRVSIVDSNPFFKAMHRRLWKGHKLWEPFEVRRGKPLNQLLERDVKGYGAYITAKVEASAPPLTSACTRSEQTDLRQMGLTFDDHKSSATEHRSAANQH